MAAEAADQDQQGRDFPKTLIFDEPGIDDEISLPTLILPPGSASQRQESDLDFELDKRLTNSLSVQVNIGYSMLGRVTGPAQSGWQDSDVTLKYVVLQNPAAEQLVSLSLTREFGGSGASRISAQAVGATTGAVNFGQGFVPFAASPVLKPLALTGSLGYLVPDDTGRDAAQLGLFNASLQYSLDVLMGDAREGRLGVFRPLIPIVECSYVLPTSGNGARRGLAAPGLIYAGDGFQLAAEALLPLTAATGHRVGFIAQLNISLRTLGLAALSRPLFGANQ